MIAFKCVRILLMCIITRNKIQHLCKTTVFSRLHYLRKMSEACLCTGSLSYQDDISSLLNR